MDIEKIIAQMTLEEKASLCSGSDSWHTQPIERLDVPAVMMADGPHGLRKEIVTGKSDIIRDSYPAICFPTASALASSWNRDLVRQVGTAIGEECLAQQVSVVLGPGANIKRSPLCGRNFEYFSEDPYLTGEMAAAFIQGVQNTGVGTSLKHFTANNQEYRRMLISAVVDERALREIYLAGFETAVKKGKPWTVMAAYNKVNGAYCTENEKLLNNILRDKWGFEGIVISDWGAVNDRVSGIAAGMDLEMPGIPNGNQELIVQAVQEGRLSRAALDRVVRHMLDFINTCEAHLKEDYQCDLETHHQLAMQAAAESAVLLKNESNLLPIKKEDSIALIGQFAKMPRYQGSGSSLIHPSRLDTLYDAMRAYAGTDRIKYADGYLLDAEDKNGILQDHAVNIAKNADIVVICAGLTDMDEVESMDRQHLRLPEAQEDLINAVSQVNPNIIVLLSNGSPVEMPWIKNVPAVLEGYLSGQAGAGAHCALLYGEINPSGKLAETFPLSLEDTPSYAYFPGGPRTVEYRESIFVGYRFYDSVKKDVLFPFGYGLSYTTFTYHDLGVVKKRGGIIRGSFVVKNTGQMAGSEIAQIYVHPKTSGVYRPDQELKEFIKIDLRSGEEKKVSFELDRRSFAYFSKAVGDWVVEGGEYEIRVGASSRDIRLSTVITIDGDENIHESTPSSFYRHFPQDALVPKKAFAQILGHDVPENSRQTKPYTLNTPIMDMQDSLVGRVLKKVIGNQIEKMVEEDMHKPTRMMIEQMALESPLRVLMMFSAGVLNRRMLDRLLKLANFRFVWCSRAKLRSGNKK